jgi:hypothetical protein
MSLIVRKFLYLCHSEILSRVKIGGTKWVIQDGPIFCGDEPLIVSCDNLYEKRFHHTGFNLLKSPYLFLM